MYCRPLLAISIYINYVYTYICVLCIGEHCSIGIILYIGIYIQVLWIVNTHL